MLNYLELIIHETFENRLLQVFSDVQTLHKTFYLFIYEIPRWPTIGFMFLG